MSSRKKETRKVYSTREAVNSKDGKLWENAMVEEMAYLDKNESWDVRI
jgi:hypothetical protein